MPGIDTSTTAGASILVGTIKKEQHFTAIFARRAADRLAATGDSGFRLNPRSIKPVAPAIGAAEKRRLPPGHAATRAANLVALQATLELGKREPQAKSAQPRTAASEYGWYWAAPEARAVGQRPLAPAVCARSGEVKYAEAFASVFLAGPLCVLCLRGRALLAQAAAALATWLSPFLHSLSVSPPTPPATRRSPSAAQWSAQALPPRSKWGGGEN